MSTFFVLMVVGLLGMLLMALPGLNRHGHAGVLTHGHGGVSLHGHAHVGNGPSHPGHAGAVHGRPGRNTANNSNTSDNTFFSRIMPNPRVIFGLLTAYGAFGYALTGAAHLIATVSAWVAILPAIAIQRYLLEPLWKAMMAFQGKPAAPLSELVLSEAVAVTPFRNGKGIVRIIRDGRDVQFSARLSQNETTQPVAVGDKLLVEEVDDVKERVIVSIR